LPSASVFEKKKRVAKFGIRSPDSRSEKRSSADAENARALREKKDGQQSMWVRRNARPKLQDLIDGGISGL
jgi:hypothetical protein